MCNYCPHHAKSEFLPTPKGVDVRLILPSSADLYVYFCVYYHLLQVLGGLSFIVRYVDYSSLSNVCAYTRSEESTIFCTISGCSSELIVCTHFGPVSVDMMFRLHKID